MIEDEVALAVAPSGGDALCGRIVWLRTPRDDAGRPKHDAMNPDASDDRALTIRDRVLPLVRARGTLELQRASLRLITLRMAPWTFDHRTPFNELSAEEASSPGYRHAVGRQQTRPDLPYGLDLHRGAAKVLSVLWPDCGSFKLVCFVRSAWEDEALALAL